MPIDRAKEPDDFLQSAASWNLTAPNLVQTTRDSLTRRGRSYGSIGFNIDHLGTVIMEIDAAKEKGRNKDWTRAETKNLREIEKAGFQWAVRCFDYYLTREDLEFFALRYKPFFEAMEEVQQGKGSVVRFNPFSQHRHCELLFGIAFSQHGARMISPSEYPLGKVPDLRFAAFERGVIQSLRNLYQLEREGKLSAT